MIEGILPVREVVGVVVNVPNVRNTVFLQIGVDSLADSNQAVLVPARNVEEPQLIGRLCRIGRKLRRRLGVRSGGKTANPSEGVEVAETEVQRLPAAH